MFQYQNNSISRRIDLQFLNGYSHYIFGLVYKTQYSERLITRHLISRKIWKPEIFVFRYWMVRLSNGIRVTSGHQMVTKLDRFINKIFFIIKWYCLVTIPDIECLVLLMSGYRMVIWISKSSLTLIRSFNNLNRPDIRFLRYIQCHCYNFVHENVGNPALNTRPTILNLFFVHFYSFGDGLVKSLISNIYCQNIRLWMKCNHLKKREILSLTQNESEKCL
jgi:hypothetical protein